jgi:kynurenine formamidase
MLVDLTLEAEATQQGRPTAQAREVVITPDRDPPYTAAVYDFRHNGMLGTYLDLPGHIRATDDGADAANFPLARLYRLSAAVLRLDKASGAGEVTEAELAAAGPPPPAGGGLVVNALGSRRFDQIDPRSVYLGRRAVEWIVDSGTRLLVCDIYESQPLHGVFARLFVAGIATVCRPVNLHLLAGPEVRLTVLTARFRGVTQLPCRVVAEMEDPTAC